MKFHHPPYTGDTQMFLIQIPPSEIGFINSLTEGYDGLALVRTRDAESGLIEFYVIPEQRRTFEAYLDALEREIPLRRMAVQ